MKPKSSSVVTALGFKSLQMAFCFILTYVLFSVLKIWEERAKRTNVKAGQMSSGRLTKHSANLPCVTGCPTCSEMQKVAKAAIGMFPSSYCKTQSYGCLGWWNQFS